MKLLAARSCGGPAAAGHIGLAISAAQVLSVVFTPAVAVLQSRVGQLHGEARIGRGARPARARPAAARARPGAERGVPGDGLAGRLRGLGRRHRGDRCARPSLRRRPGCCWSATASTSPRCRSTSPCSASASIGCSGSACSAIAVLNTLLGAVVTQYWPSIEALGLVYGVLMLALVLLVTAPAALRRFPVPIPRVFVARARAAGSSLSAAGLVGRRCSARASERRCPISSSTRSSSPRLCLPGLELGAAAPRPHSRRLGVRT